MEKLGEHLINVFDTEKPPPPPGGDINSVLWCYSNANPHYI